MMARIRGESLVTWDSLIQAVMSAVEERPARELAQSDADRLEAAAEAIRLKLAASDPRTN